MLRAVKFRDARRASGERNPDTEDASLAATNDTQDFRVDDFAAASSARITSDFMLTS